MDPKILEQLLRSISPFINTTDCKITKLEPGDVALEMDVVKTNLNHLGTFHAGALFTLGETTGGVAMLSYQKFHSYKLLVKGGKVSYLRPVAKKAIATAILPKETADSLVAETDANGKATTFIDVKVMNEKDELAAEMQFEYYMRKQ